MEGKQENVKSMFDVENFNESKPSTSDKPKERKNSIKDAFINMVRRKSETKNPVLPNKNNKTPSPPDANKKQEPPNTITTVTTATTVPSNTKQSNIFTAIFNPVNSSNLNYLQSYINQLFDYLDGDYTVFELAQMEGDRSIGFFLFGETLIYYGFEKNTPQYNNLLNVAQSVYMKWLKYLPNLYKLCINLNGEDPTKEMMNIINYHVFLLLKFVIEKFLDQPFDYETIYDLEYIFKDYVVPAVTNYNDLTILQNANITNAYNSQIIRLTPVERLYNNLYKTNTVKINYLTLLESPKPKDVKEPFVVQKFKDISLI
ncbi:unknown [Cryptophlebia leucotreta granulovirus]|uniref:Uncharacterized protein n=1 Tax=Cryptophlebia leucotreta granulosis virus TaxID=35254 RepID=Q7T5H1_GVCL|nr:hypothetical protein [Cryptophlebia leucotreta granulovirus]AAQ21717.1 unknown [Cryptophlebia leucotreta granulovirus]